MEIKDEGKVLAAGMMNLDDAVMPARCVHVVAANERQYV